jgi:hypothetical protein
MHPRLPAFDWVREHDAITEIDLDIRSHRVVRFHGKWYVVW